MGVTFLTWFYRAQAYLLSTLHYRSLWHTFLAYFRGIRQTGAWLVRFVNAASKPELKLSNPTKHHAETSFRRWLVITTGGIIALVCLVLITGTGALGRAFAAFGIPLEFSGLGVTALAVEFIAQAALFIAIGRTDALVVRVQTRRIAGEQLLLKITNDLTLTAAQIKQAFSSSIIQPPARLPSNRGYDTIVRVHEQGKPHLLVNNPSAVAHKLQKPGKTVFVYRVESDESQVRILVLDVDPWSLKPTVNPLVARPRRINLWRETVSMGTKPDFTDVRERLVEAGDGGGRLGGGAPRSGKSVLLSNWIVALMLDPTTHLHIIDGSAVDFQPVRPLCDTYVGDAEITDKELLARAHATLRMLKKEIARRKVILFRHGTNKLSEELSDQYRLGTHWFICDELAVITEDMMKSNRDAVQEFLEDLLWVCRMGPKYGVFEMLATQRPTEKSVPPALKDLIILRTALYIPSDSGSRAILGQSGPANRADKLDPDQKGVAIAIRVGQYRTHLVEVPDLASVAQVAASIRAQYNSGVIPLDTTMEHPEPVKTLLTIITKIGATEVETLTLIEHLQELGYESVTEKKLAGSLKLWGIEPRRFYRTDGSRFRGYSRVELERVPKIKRQVSFPVPGTGQVTCGTAGQDSTEWAAHTGPEDGS